jgi:GWxTD domain-containing protein
MIKALLFGFLLLPVFQDLNNDQVQMATIEYLFDAGQKQDFEAITTRQQAPWAPTKYLENFWRKYDSSPSDGVNELLELFIRRVEDSVVFDLAGRFEDGWKTDRGKVFIFFGAPQEVIRSGLDPTLNSYEIWVYCDAEDNDKRCEIRFSEKAEDGQLTLETEILFPEVIQESGTLPEVESRQ